MSDLSEPPSAVTYHEESSSVVVLLEELVFALGGFVGDLSSTVTELGPALLLRQAVESVDFSLLLLHAEDKHHSLIHYLISGAYIFRSHFRKFV